MDGDPICIEDCWALSKCQWDQWGPIVYLEDTLETEGWSGLAENQLWLGKVLYMYCIFVNP